MNAAWIGLGCLWLGMGATLAQAEETEPEVTPEPAPRVDAAGRVHVGAVVIAKDRRSLRIPGHVNMDRDQVELLACGAEGKTHESVLILHAEALHLHAALLLVGIQPVEGPKGFGDWKPHGPTLDVWIEWMEDGTTRREPSARWVRNSETKKSPDTMPWIFTGSGMLEGRYVAAQEQSLLATWWDPFAVINVGLPEGAHDALFEANPEVVPKRGTAIFLEIRLPPAP